MVVMRNWGDGCDCSRMEKAHMQNKGDFWKPTATMTTKMKNIKVVFWEPSAKCQNSRKTNFTRMRSFSNRGKLKHLFAGSPWVYGQLASILTFDGNCSAMELCLILTIQDCTRFARFFIFTKYQFLFTLIIVCYCTLKLRQLGASDSLITLHSIDWACEPT